MDNASLVRSIDLLCLALLCAAAMVGAVVWIVRAERRERARIAALTPDERLDEFLDDQW
ncbi:MAG TPA: hypothetical protein VNU71_03470 [Burkholderiaceae bacterium]|nr:hypothetical protein [Burkholderiaceae bacterium]